MSRICSTITNDLARTHVSYYNDNSKRTKGMYLHAAHSKMPGVTRRTAAGPVSSSTATGTSSPPLRGGGDFLLP